MLTERSGQTTGRLAERQGFEPWIEFPLYTLSKRAPSATRPSLRFEKGVASLIVAGKKNAGRERPASQQRFQSPLVFALAHLLRQVVLNAHLFDES